MMNPKVAIESLTKTKLSRKFAIAFVFMSLVPIVLTVYIIYWLKLAPMVQRQVPYFNITIIFTVLLSLASFDLIRRSMLALEHFSRKAKEIASGEYFKRVDVEESDEVGLLAQSFNKITGELEEKINELETSKKLLQHILEKVGTAVSSAKGIDNLLELILQSLVEGVGATSGAIYLVDNASDKMNMQISFGLSDDLKKISVNTRDGLIGRVCRLKATESVASIKTNPAAYSEFSKGLAKYSLLASPLLFRDELIGTILINDKKSGEFDNDDMILLGNVAAQTAVAIKNAQMDKDAEKTYIETITALAVAVEAKDRYSRGHIDRVAKYVEGLSKQMHLDEEFSKLLMSGAVLHDVGKIGIRDAILLKKGPLSKEEEKEMREHAIIGVNIIRPIKSMAALCDLVRHHQEFYDGSGYPDGLKGDEIPLSARILKVCDAYDAMTTDRPYRKAMSKKEATKELQEKSGSEFDPKIVKEFLKAI
ncbi:HD domain-containing phosphohydrolase [Candidatus Omnitrophota bacterium]